MDIQGEIHALFSFHGLISLILLAVLELVLGVDNIIFISLALTKIPEEKRFTTRVTALSLAFVMRVIMLFCIVWLSRITTTVFTISSFDISIRDVLFFIGGAYLIVNTGIEFKKHLENKNQADAAKQTVYSSIILQIVLVDLLFSFDSIFTAIGLVPSFLIMALAVGIGMVFMIWLSGATSQFIEKHRNIKSLALCFIILVGVMLITKTFHIDIPKFYVYATFVLLLAGASIYLLVERNKQTKE